MVMNDRFAFFISRTHTADARARAGRDRATCERARGALAALRHVRPQTTLHARRARTRGHGRARMNATNLTLRRRARVAPSRCTAESIDMLACQRKRGRRARLSDASSVRAACA